MSSLGYAEKLSYRADVGTVGMPELFDSTDDLQSKIEELAQLISASRHLVVFTGAGISTSCGIPDFRGPKGIWTLQHEGKPMPKIDVPFDQARPGITHMTLFELQQAGILKFIVSQNIDGLHLRSGIARSQLAELHGNCFREVCASCEKEYFRDFEIETLGCKPTGRRCTEHDCAGKLLDTIVDWEDALPPAELRAAEKHTKKADLVLCLGTSLQITPACNLPLRTVRAGGKMVIVNLQATPKDKSAALLIRGRVDEVISGVMSRLQRTIPPYVHIDRILLSYYYYWTKKKSVKWYFRIASIHGPKMALPFIKSIEVMFPGRPEFKPATFTKPPCLVRRETMRLKELDIALKLQFAEGCMCTTGKILQTLTFEAPPEQKKIEKVDTAEALDSLRLRAVEEGICGVPTLISAHAFPDTSQGSTMEYGVVTRIVNHVPVGPETIKEEQAIKEEEVAIAKRDSPNNVAQKKIPKRQRRT